MASIKKNFLYSSAYQILTMILPLVTSPYVSRVLGAEGIGINSYTYSIVYYFVLFAKLGLQNYGNRAIASVRQDKQALRQTFIDLYVLHVIITLIVIGVYTGYVFAFGGNYKLFFLLQGGYLIGQLLDISWFFFGIEEFKVTVLRNTIVKILIVVGTLLLVKDSSDLWIYVAIIAFGAALGEGTMWLSIKKHITFVKPDFRNFPEHFKGMLVFFLPSVAVSLYKIMDKVMLGSMSGAAQTGFYENSEKIINICLGFITSLGTVMLPRMTNLVATGKEKEGKKLILKSTDISYIGAYAMCFGIIGISSTFATVFWGEEFAQCSILLTGLAISIIFSAIASVVRNQFLIPQKRDKVYISSVCVGAAVNLIANLICIPRLNALGAVLGTVLAEFSVFAVQLFFTRKDLPHKQFFLNNICYGFLGLGMCIFCHLLGQWLGTSITTVIIQILVGGIFYVTGVILLWIIRGDKEYLQLVTKIFGKFGRKKEHH